MAIFTEPQRYDAALANNYFNEDKVGTLDVLGATFEQTLYENPMSALGRTVELYNFSNKYKKLTPEEYKESQFYREGIEVPSDGIYEGAALILAERYDNRMRRQSVLNRSQGGFFTGTAQFGVSLIGSMLDPINVGVSFIPYVGQARWAQLGAKSGTTKARLLRGGVEGSIGAAVVEPLVYGAAKYEQDPNYTLFDSLMNVAIGGVLGAGLQAGGGAIADAIKRSNAKHREVFLRTAVGQLAEGRQVDIEPALKADPNLRETVDSLGPAAPPRRGFSMLSPQKTRKVKNKVTGEVTEVAFGLPNSLKILNNPPETLLQFIRRNGGVWTQEKNIGDIIQIFDKDRSLVNKERGAVEKKPGQKRISKKKLAGGKTLDELAELLTEAGFYTERPTISQLLDDISSEKRQGVKKHSQMDADKVTEFENAEAMLEELSRNGIDPTGRTDAEINAILQEQAELQEAGDRVPVDIPDGLTEQEFADLQQRLHEAPDEYPELEDFADELEEMDKVDALFDEETLAIDKEIEQLEAQLASVEPGVIPRDILDEVTAAAELERKAQSYDEATAAAAQCLIGKV